MKLIFKFLIALVISSILTGITAFIVGYVNFFYTGEIPIDFAIIAIVISFILYFFVTGLIAYLSSK